MLIIHADNRVTSGLQDNEVKSTDKIYSLLKMPNISKPRQDQQKQLKPNQAVDM